jgi:hypothetical protein
VGGARRGQGHSARGAGRGTAALPRAATGRSAARSEQGHED